MAYKIFTRSPYVITFDNASLTASTLSLYIYTGTQGSGGDRPATAQYVITPSLTTDTGGDKRITVEISELIRDYIDLNFRADTFNSSAVWVDAIFANTGIANLELNFQALDGYGDWDAQQQNYNNTVYTKINDQTGLISIEPNTTGSTIYRKSGDDIVFPFSMKDTTSTTIYFKNDSSTIATFGAYSSAETDSDNIIRYLSSSDQNINKIEVVGSSTNTYYVKTIEECNHPAYKLTFVNKFGAYENLYFWKRADERISTTSSTFKANIATYGAYNKSDHSKKILRKMGNESLSLNSGFYPEYYNETFKQLMLSERVWIKYNGSTLPINITSSQLTYKTTLNDKLINYKIDAEFAFDAINNIR